MSTCCRVCLQYVEEVEILDLSLICDEEAALTYSECFTVCTKIVLNINDGLPYNLCKSCGVELQMAYDFHKKVDESKKVLSQMLRPPIKIEASTSAAAASALLAASSFTVTEAAAATTETEKQQQQKMFEGNELNLMDQYADEDNMAMADDDMPMESYRESEEEDARSETIEIKIKRTACADAEEYEIERLLESSADDECESEVQQEHEDEMSWQAAVVTVANEEHLPLQYIHTIELDDDDDDDDGAREDEVADAEQQHEDFVDDGYDEQEAENASEQITYAQEQAEEETAEVDEEADAADAIDKYSLNSDNESIEEHAEDVEATAALSNENEIFKKIPVLRKCTQTKKRKNVENSEQNTTKRKRRHGKYNCDYCQKEFPNYSRMTMHRLMHETDRPKFDCPQCKRKYASKQAMEVHVRTAHTKEGYPCPHCGKVYAIQKCLVIHMRYHTGEFPFVCDTCGKRYAQISHLNTHKKVQHNSVRFYCEFPDCCKFFTSSSSLRNHEHTHGEMPFACNICKKGYPAKAKLKVHMRRKHKLELSTEELEEMRKFQVKRSTPSLVKLVENE